MMLRVKSAFALLLTKVTKLQLLAALLSEAASPPTAYAVNQVGSDDLKRTISAMVGKGSVNHNSRKFHAENTDPSRSHLNICYCNTDIKAVYHELFDAALFRYNEKQKREDRRIENYYEKIRSGKQEKPFHELILQIGNREDMASVTENGELAELEHNIEAAQDRMEELAPAVENMEILAERFSDDPELLAPTVDRFESAKHYREKKVVPLLARIVKVLRVAYRIFLELRNDLHEMQRKYQRERNRADGLAQQVKALETENRGLKGIADDFERAERVIGIEHIRAAIQYDRDEEEREKFAKKQAKQMKKHRSKER